MNSKEDTLPTAEAGLATGVLMATLRAPTGFSDSPYNESRVRVIGFSYGSHQDAAGYGRQAQCMLAVVQEGSRLLALPIHWLTMDAY